MLPGCVDKEMTPREPQSDIGSYGEMAEHRRGRDRGEEEQPHWIPRWRPPPRTMSGRPFFAVRAGSGDLPPLSHYRWSGEEATGVEVSPALSSPAVTEIYH